MKLRIFAIVGFCLASLISSAFAQTLTFTNLTYNRGAVNQTVSVALADINGDGMADLICANYFANSVSILTNNGTGRFVSYNDIVIGIHPQLLVATDVNGDGKVDLITQNQANQTLIVLTNKGTGAFTSNSTVSLPANHDQTSIVAADMNGDGKVDLVTGNTPNAANAPFTVTVFTNNGAGIFSLGITLSLYTNGSPTLNVAIADVNGDGKPDLVCQGKIAGGAVLLIYTNNGSGAFGSNSTLMVGQTVPAFAAADVNGDGKVDLVFPDLGNNLLTVWTNNGAGIFSSNRSYAMGTGFDATVKVADINGDGSPDLILERDGTCQSSGPPCSNGTLIILTNNGSGTFALSTTITAGVVTAQVVPGEVNGDGKMDLVCLNLGYSGYASDTVMEFFNTSTFSPPILTFSNSGDNIALGWPSFAGKFTLQTNMDVSTTNWVNYGGLISDNGITKSITNPPSAAKLFFRLRQ